VLTSLRGWKVWAVAALVVTAVAAAAIAERHQRKWEHWPNTMVTSEVVRAYSGHERGILRQTIIEFPFRYDGFTEGWQANKAVAEPAVRRGMFAFRARSGAASIVRPLDVEASDVTDLSIAMAVSRGRRGEVRWEVEGGGPPKEYSLSFPVHAGDLVRRYDFNLAAQPGWRGRIRRLSIRPSDRTARVAVSDVCLTREYLPMAEGTMTTEQGPPVQVAEETRPAIIAPAPTRLRWVVEVSARPSALSVGYAVLPDAWTKSRDGVGFVIAAEDRGKRRDLFTAFLNPGAKREDRRWFDAEIDLTPFAGRQVTFVFDTLGGVPGDAQADTRYDWAVWSAPRIRPRATRSQRPNVIIVVLDSLRADHVACYGYPLGTTPNLDRLASEGVRFAQAQSQAPWTPASMASMFTSLYPHEAAPVQVSMEPPPGSPTLAETLARAGYTTGVVSSHLFISPNLGHARGVHYFLSTKDTAEACAQGVATWLERHAQEPFFLYVHCYDPHHDYQPPMRLRERFLGALQTRNVYVRKGDPTMHNQGVFGGWKTLTQEDVDYLRALYDADIAYADEQTGRMLADLARLGLRQRTLMIVTADHGEEFMEHGGMAHGRILYQQVLHVPLIMAFPGNRWRGTVVPGLVRLLDVAPTVLAVAGVPVPQGMRGRSLLGALQEKWVEQPAVAEWAEMTGPWHCAKALKLMVREGNRKFIRNSDGRWETYDVGADPAEQHNLTVDNKPPAAVAEMIEQLRKSVSEPVGGARSAMRPEALEAMKALGYIR